MYIRITIFEVYMTEVLNRQYLGESGQDINDTPVDGIAVPGTQETEEQQFNRFFGDGAPLMYGADPVPATPDVQRTPDAAPRASAPSILETPRYHEFTPQDLRTVFEINTSYDKGIGSVLESIQTDYEARGEMGYLQHEMDILEFAKSEAVRARERDILNDYDLSVDDDEFGFVKELQQRQEALANMPDMNDAAKQTHQVTATILDKFVERHDGYDGTAAQAAAAEYLDVSKKQLAAYGPGSTEDPDVYVQQVVDLSQQVKGATLDLYGSHKNYGQAIAIIDHLVEQDAEEDDDIAPAPASTTLEAAQAALATKYAKQEERLRPIEGAKKLIGKGDTLKEDYVALCREQFLAENDEFLRDPNTTHADRLQKLNEYTFARGQELEDRKREIDGRSRFKRAIHKMGKVITKHPYITGFVSAGLGLGLSTITAGAAAGVVGGALAYIKAEQKRYDAKQNRESAFTDQAKEANGMALQFSPEAFKLSSEYDADTMNDLFDRAMSINSNSMLEKQVRGERLRRLRSVGYGALGAAAGWTLAHLGGLDHLGADNADAAPAHNPDATSGQGGAPDTQPGVQPDAAPSVSPDQMPTIPDAQLTVHDFQPGTFNVQANEGWYNVLDRMGITDQMQQYNILSKAAGPLYENGFAYEMPNGFPGIPATGDLPQGAIDILIKAATN